MPMQDSSRDRAFVEFVREQRSDLVRFATLLTAGDAHRAEDLVQTALTRLYVAWPRVVRSGAPSAYVRRIVVNANLDEVRRARWRREWVMSEPPDRPDPAPAEPDETAGVVLAALRELPAGMRTAVVLRHWLDLGVEETAGLMGVGPGTVKSQTAKGVARLKDLLDQPTAERTR